MPKIEKKIETGQPLGLYDLLVAALVDIAAQKVIIDELVDDHATFKTTVDEVHTWAETLATKLNSDAGVTDTNYDATITAAAPATLTAIKTTLTVTS